MIKNFRQMGFFQIILSGLCFGFLGFFGKMAYKQNITPGELLSLRYLLSAIFTGLFIFATNPKALLSLSRFDIISSLLLGIFGYALFSSLYFFALTELPASLTVLILYTYPIIVVLFSRFFFKEKIGNRGLLSLFIVILGLIFLVLGEWNVSLQNKSLHFIFLFFAIGSSFFYAMYVIISHKLLKAVAPIPSSFYIQLGAGVILSLFNFSHHPIRFFELLADHYLLIFSMSIVCSFMAITLFLAGLQKISSSEASLFSTTEPICGVIIAATLLHEKIHSMQIIGGFFILIGLVIIATRKT